MLEWTAGWLLIYSGREPNLMMMGGRICLFYLPLMRTLYHIKPDRVISYHMLWE